MGGAREGAGAAAASLLMPLLLWMPPGKILIVIKCPLAIIHMPKYDLINVIYAREHV